MEKLDLFDGKFRKKNEKKKKQVVYKQPPLYPGWSVWDTCFVHSIFMDHLSSHKLYTTGYN